METFKNWPGIVRHRRQLAFLMKMLGAYGVWYAVYDLWLLPAGWLDAWLSHGAATVSGGLLSGFGLETWVNGRTLWLNAPVPSGVQIVDGCNGLSTIGLFVGFVLAYPGVMRRRLVFLPLGVLVVFLANIVRIALLAVFQVHWAAAFDVVHSLGATTLFYAVVGVLWVGWMQYGTPSEVSVQRLAARQAGISHHV